MRVGLLGGSFDPVHYGHLRAAQWAIEACALQEVRLVPARQSPFKDPCVASGEDRASMLSRAIEGNASLRVEDCDLRRDPPSYTVDTLRTLTSREPGATFILILGSDAAKGLEKWREPGEIRRMAQILVVGRHGDPARQACDLRPFETALLDIPQLIERARAEDEMPAHAPGDGEHEGRRLQQDASQRLHKLR